MRFIVIISIWLVAFSSVTLFLTKKSSNYDHYTQKKIIPDKIPVSINIHSTFKIAQNDPFALNIEDETKKGPSINLVLNSKKINITYNSDFLNINKEISIKENSINELFVKTIIPEQSKNSNNHHEALRIHILKGGQTILDKSLWGKPGQSLSESFTFEVNEI